MANERENATVQVKVRLYAGLRRYLPELSLGQSLPLQLPQGTTIGEMLDQLGIPRTETKSCFVNGIQREFSYQLKEGDDLAAFPPVAGGCGEGPTQPSIR